MDRPVSDSLINKNKNKEYIQPQYIVDCVNNLHLLPTSQYRPGIPPPPHLSPFIDNQAEGYIPMRQKEIQHLKGEEVVESDEDEDLKEVPQPLAPKSLKPKDTVKSKGDADSSSESDEDLETE